MHNRFSSHLHSSFREIRAEQPGIVRPRLTRRSPQRRGVKRSGQALLLSILLMVFIALLAATFVTVVALNMNQTARTVDKNLARQAATTGIKYVNDQLTSSPEGLDWFKTQQHLLPLPNTPEFDAYYNAVDRAQGRSGGRDIGYVKFPDPRRPVSGDTPNFTVKVDTIKSSDGDNSNGEKTGDLRITVIGVSPDDPTAFSRIVSYKGGPRRNPMGSAMRAVSNNYLAGGAVPHGFSTTSSLTGTTSLTIGHIEGKFPEAPFYVMIGGPTRLRTGTTSVRSVAVTDYNNGTLTLATPIVVVPEERVEIAATLGMKNKFNPKGTIPDPGSPLPSTQDYPFDVSAVKTVGASTYETAGSALVNGAISWFGRVSSHDLTYGSPEYVRSSGLQNLHVEDPSTPASILASTASVGVSGNYNGGSVKNVPLVSSDNSNFPGPWTDGGVPLTAAQKDSLWSDGYSRMMGNSGVAGGARNTREFVPPDILDASQGINRYLQLTKFAASSDTSYPDAALYGYSNEGIYINNSEDRPKVYAGTQLREMTQKELVDMLMSPAAAGGTAYQRKGSGAPVNAPTASLEQKHLRGWVAPDQFLPRGALVELNITPAKSTITITRDARSDANPAQADQPDDNKTWQDKDGNHLPGVYTQTFPWPSDGTIYAEGDIRIKGGVSAPDTGNANVGAPSSLTVVSMGDIYVEGSLNAGGINSKRKILLLARHNVIANPTSMLPRADAHTRVLSASTTGGVTTLTVADAERFKQGDLIVVGSNANTSPTGLPVSMVAAANYDGDITTSDTLKLNSDISASALVAKGAAVRTVSDRDQPANAATPYLDSVTYGSTNYFKRVALETTSQAIQRRLFVPQGASSTVPIRLALLHSAVGHTALTVDVNQALTPFGVQLDSARIGSMMVDPPTRDASLNQTILYPSSPTDPQEKALTVAYKNSGDPGESLDQFPATATDTIATVAAAMNGKYDPAAHWYYEATEGTAYSGLPLNYLASWGNRKKSDNDNDATSGGVPFNNPNSVSTPGTTTFYGGWRFPSFPKTGTSIALPIATSVDFLVNGLGADLRAIENQNYAVSTFGFNPALTDPTDPKNLAAVASPQDVLTSDSVFYDKTGYTYDSRALDVNAGGDNAITMRLDNALSSLSTADMPSYQLATLKIENGGMFDSTKGYFQGITPGDTLDIRAFVYAQQGSWLVIPGAYVDENIKDNILPFTGSITAGGPSISGYYYDFNGDKKPFDTSKALTTNPPASNEYALYYPNGSTIPTMVPDLNRDGEASVDEYAMIARFLRYNYSVSLTGAILENKTAMVLDESSTVTGAVQAWSDKWLNTTVLPDVKTLPNTDPSPETKTTYDFLQYHFDPALSRVDANGNLYLVNPNDLGLHIPVPSNLLYEE